MMGTGAWLFIRVNSVHVSEFMGRYGARGVLRRLAEDANGDVNDCMTKTKNQRPERIRKKYRLFYLQILVATKSC